MLFPKEHPDFITVTCLEWKHALANDAIKEIIISSMRHLITTQRVNVFAFCIMSNHLHMIWQITGDNKRVDVKRDFLKYTGQQILQRLKNTGSPLLNELYVGAKDRNYQVWERNSLSIPLYSDRFFSQKLDYIHNNPVNAGLCKYPEDYYYSSAAFYYKDVMNFDFLVHFNG
jgi:REP element-mobilizing transposase RayT